MTAGLRAGYHSLAFGWYGFVLLSLAAKDGEELPEGIFVYGGPWKYLTFINLVLQMVFFGMAAMNDLQRGKKYAKSNGLSRFTDFLFSVFAFPVGMFVVLLFWVIFSYDRQLVYPASLDGFFPPWMNHAMHSFVLPILLGEIVIQPHACPDTKNGLAALLVVGVAYLSWVVWVYLSVGIWVYPFLGLLSPAGLVGLFIFNMAVVALLYLLGLNLNSCVWGKDMAKSKTK